MPVSLRSFLEKFREECPQDYVEIEREVDPIYEVTAIQKKLAKEGRHPVLVFKRMKGSRFPLVCNLYATRRHLAVGLGVPVEELVEFYARAEDSPVDPVYVEDAPSQEVVYAGDQVDLRMLPVVKAHQQDAAPCLTATLFLVRDPRSGAHSVFFGRLQRVDRNLCYTHMAPGRHLHTIFSLMEEQGRPVPVSINIGLHPAWALAATSLVLLDYDELRVAGALAREPVRLARCKTVDADCLADCEMVLEGYILPRRREPEGPFCEFPGYSTGQRPRQVIQITALTMRRDALYQHITAGSNDNLLIGAISKEARILRVARAAAPTVRVVHLPLSGCGRFHCYVSMEQRASSDLDPSTDEEGITCKAIIDATAKPTLKEFKPRATVPAEMWERIRLEDYVGGAARALP